MTRILVAAVARPNRRSDVRRATEGYEARLAKLLRFDSALAPPAGLRDERAEAARQREAEGLARILPGDLELVALTRVGEAWSTRRLADYLGEMRAYGRPGAAFAVGGAHGLAPRLLERARARLSLSALTLPHEVARLVLTEQLYRAATILRGTPYHKGGRR